MQGDCTLILHQSGASSSASKTVQNRAEPNRTEPASFESRKWDAVALGGVVHPRFWVSPFDTEWITRVAMVCFRLQVGAIQPTTAGSQILGLEVEG